MVTVTKEELAAFDIPEEQADILNYLSEESDEDEEHLRAKFTDVEPLVVMDDKFPSTIVLVGVPKVTMDKTDRLKLVLQRKISEELERKGGEDLSKDLCVYMPTTTETGMTKGFCVITFPSEYHAQHAVRTLNGYELDKKHTFKAVPIDEFNEIVMRDKNYKPPIKLLGFTREDFRWWLMDGRGREHFCIRYGDETEIYTHDPLEQNACVLLYDGKRERQEGRRVWTDFRVHWSTQGSYLATFHRPGIALWAGDSFEKKVRFEHKEVKQIEFSPNETYMLSWDGSPASLRNERAVKVWDVMTGQLLRQFSTPALSPRGTDFPHFLFSHDDKYLAKIGDKELCVYSMHPSDNGVDENSEEQDLTPVKLLRDHEGHFTALKFPVEKFEWSPADNILSIWIRGSEDAPGRLILVDIPSRRELSSKNVYNVKGATMHWQSKGDYLCLRTVVFKKTGKKGRKEFTQLDIFRMKEKDIPVDNVQLTDVAVQLHWEEGYSKRFALVVQDEGTSSQSLRFYCVMDAVEGGLETNKRDTVMTHSFEISAYMNFLKWSPFGSYFILASLGFDGTLMFCHLNDQDKVEVLHQDEHFMVNEVKWSACGRCLATAVSMPIVPSSANQTFRLESNSGYNLWTFQGKLLTKVLKDKFYQFLWRPHPPSLLKKERFEEIKKKMKDYSKRYEAEDEKQRNEQRAIYTKQRKSELDEFARIMDELHDWSSKHECASEWELARQELDDMFEWEDKEEVIEEELDVKQEIIN